MGPMVLLSCPGGPQAASSQASLTCFTSLATAAKLFLGLHVGLDSAFGLNKIKLKASSSRSVGFIPSIVNFRQDFATAKLHPLCVDGFHGLALLKGKSFHDGLE